MPKRTIQRIATRARTEDVKARDAFKTADSFQNFAAALGIGADTLLSGGTYGFNPITRIRTLLEWIHRGSWLGGVAIDLVANDMTKMGVEVRGEIDPEAIAHLDRAVVSWQIWNQVCDTIKWARLYGGAIAFMLINGQNPETPLRLETVGRNAFRGLLVLDRWMVEPSLNDLVTEMGPDLGLPKFYMVTADAPALPRMKIHYSRCLRLEGIRLPYWQRLMENLWGISVLERLYDRMIAFDSATTGAAQLVYKSYLRTYKIEGLRELIAAGGPAYQGLLKMIEMMRAMQSNEGITLIDMKDEFATFQHSAFAGLSEAILQFGQQLSGALQIPLVRLFGQSPAGLNATGEADLRTYYDGIKQQQEATLKIPLTRIYQALAQSEGIQLPEGFTLEFRPLWQLTETEKVALAGQVATSVTQVDEAGIIGRDTALKELKQSSKLSGIFTNITDEDIEEAEAEPPPGALELEAQKLELETAASGEERAQEQHEQALKEGANGKPNGKVNGKANGKANQRSADRRIGKHHTVSPVHSLVTTDSRDAVTSVSWGGSRKRSGGKRRRRHKGDAPKRLATRSKPRDQGAAPSALLGNRQVAGFNLVIEHAKGDLRNDRALPADYGYLRLTDSAEPDNQMDCFVGEDVNSPKIFIVDSYKQNGEFDEHKIMLGYSGEHTALSDFRSYYYNNRAQISEVADPVFKEWLVSGDVRQPYAQPADTKYTASAGNPDQTCAKCRYFEGAIFCVNKLVARDPKVPEVLDGSKVVSPAGWCSEWEAR